MIDSPAVLLAHDQLPEACTALGRAFMDDPLETYTLPSAAERARLAPAHFEPLVRFGLAYGQVLTTPGEPLGVAIWLDQDAEFSEAACARIGVRPLADYIGVAPAARFESVLGFLAPYHARHAPGKHWYLAALGVDPAAQGQGLGAGLVRGMLARADAEGVPCYLETAQPRNVGFYRRLGFTVLDEVVEPASGLALWTFRRDPR